VEAVAKEAVDRALEGLDLEELKAASDAGTPTV